MKKFLAILLTLAIFSACGLSAFAAHEHANTVGYTPEINQDSGTKTGSLEVWGKSAKPGP